MKDHGVEIKPLPGQDSWVELLPISPWSVAPFQTVLACHY